LLDKELRVDMTEFEDMVYATNNIGKKNKQDKNDEKYRNLYDLFQAALYCNKSTVEANLKREHVFELFKIRYSNFDSTGDSIYKFKNLASTISGVSHNRSFN
jgi:hypothetical protein